MRTLVRAFWVALSRLWPSWKNHLVVVRPWSSGPRAAHESSDCHALEVFTTDIPGAKPLDQRLPRLRSAHQTSRMNFENRQEFRLRFGAYSGYGLTSPRY